jgi:hypothetical protein
MFQGKNKSGLKLVLEVVLAFASVSAAQAENFVFETSTAQLVIQSNGAVSSLIEKPNGKEQLQPAGLAFAMVVKNGQKFPASTVERRDPLFHFTFGTSGVSADYRITASTEYIVVELAAIQGDGIEKFQMVQFSTSLVNAGGPFLNVLWNDQFAISLMGLSEQVDTEIAGTVASASVYPTFSVKGQRIAIIAVPTPQFLDVVQAVEQDFRLPSPTIGGVWAKLSTDERTSYFFADLTEANADEMIRYAKLGGLRYILIRSDSWAASLGSYPINLESFPHGEAGLKSVINKCHAAGLKVGMRMLTSLVGKNDPIVRPKPNPGLLKDGKAVLATDVSEQATELTAASALAGFSLSTDSSDFVTDDEIIHCGRINGTRFLQCERGFAGTKPELHKSGAIVQHLVERNGAYMADLRSPLAVAISDRISGVINRVGFDMIYFDGGELNSAQGAASWYWVGVQQTQIWQRSKRDLLMQGSGATNWTWHLFARGTCDDIAAVAVKQYLDYHKIADDWTLYHSNFVPVDLGWVGILQDTPDHPATTPDELEYHAVRMLALGSPVGLQTYFNVLKRNGRTDEMLKMLGAYERLRMSGEVPKALREKLGHGEWHMTGRGEFHPIRYDAQRMAIPGEITFKNRFEGQPLKFRLQVAPELAATGDPANIPLLRSQPPVELRPPGTQDAMPGALVQRVELSKASQRQRGTFMAGLSGRALDLTTHRALAVQLDVEGSAQASGESPVLNVQLEAGGKTLRDYYIDLDFRGSKTVILPEPGTGRMLADFRPAAANYPFKTAMSSFNYANVVALNLRWMRFPKDGVVRCWIGSVEALEERSSVLKDLVISAGSVKIAIPGEMETGDYAEYWGEGSIHVFDRNGVLLRVLHANRAPMLRAGDERVAVKASTPGNVKLTAITLAK